LTTLVLAHLVTSLVDVVAVVEAVEAVEDSTVADVEADVAVGVSIVVEAVVDAVVPPIVAALVTSRVKRRPSEVFDKVSATHCQTWLASSTAKLGIIFSFVTPRLYKSSLFLSARSMMLGYWYRTSCTQCLSEEWLGCQKAMCVLVDSLST